MILPDRNRNGPSDVLRDAGVPIVVGLVNNTGDAALRTTERQFVHLLSQTPLGFSVEVRRFFLPGIQHSAEMQTYLGQHYETTDELWDRQLDGIIVTGAEPRAAVMTQESYWTDLTRLIEWAEANTISSVWSCLAAHAAVLHLDGIARRPLDKKLSGIFDCHKVADHPLVAGLPAKWGFPHSRYNGLPPKLLAASGYVHLSLSPEAGADLFIKQLSSLFVFMHGHPEYDPDSLFREYRRDVGRFLSGERDEYPDPPQFYFDTRTEAALANFRKRALRQRSAELLPELPARMPSDLQEHPWRNTARLFLANWLSHLAAEKAARSTYVRSETLVHQAAQQLAFPSAP